jgi:hypothetical protein
MVGISNPVAKAGRGTCAKVPVEDLTLPIFVIEREDIGLSLIGA